jgi:RNA polymerase sigma factor (sigma-70 family)
MDEEPSGDRMAGDSAAYIGAVRRLFEAGPVTGVSESELLRRFREAGDEAAFAALLARHGPMVLGVCRRALGRRAEVEDAFQATFLILARKAASIRDGDRLGPWLYGVARRVAARARADGIRRADIERRAARGEAVVIAEADRIDLRSALDEELDRLPSGYREAVVLCYFGGLSHEEAARRLRCPVGTVKSRIARGIDRLRSRMARRGTAPALMIPVSDPVPSTLVAATQSVGPWSAGSASLARGVLKTMMIRRWLSAAAVAAAIGVTAASVGARLGPAREAPAAAGARTAPARGPDVRNPDGESPGEITITRPARGRVIRLGPESGSKALAFAPDGGFLVAGCADGRIRLIDPAKAKVIATLVHHEGAGPRTVSAVAVRPDGRAIASAGEDGRVRLSDLDRGGPAEDLGREPPAGPDGNPPILWGLAFSPDGTTLAWGGNEAHRPDRGIVCLVRLYDLKQRRVRAILTGHGGGISGVAFSPDGRLVATSSYDATVRLWDAVTGRPAGELEDPGGPAYDVAFSPDGRTLASAGAWNRPSSRDGHVPTGGVTLWDLAARRMIGHLEQLPREASCVAFSRDGRLLAHDGPDKVVTIWDASTYQAVGRLTAPETPSCIVFAPDGRTLASSHAEGTIRLWAWDLAAVPAREGGR